MEEIINQLCKKKNITPPLNRFACWTNEGAVDLTLENARLKEALDFNQKMIALSDQGIFAYHESGACVLTNEAAARMIGTSAERLQAQNFRELDYWKTTGMFGLAERALATGEDQRGEFHFKNLLGKEIWVDALFTQFSNDGDLFLLLITNDITTKKYYEAKSYNFVARTEGLARVATCLNAQLDQASILQIICEETIRILNVPSAGIFMEGEPKKTIAFHQGLPQRLEYGHQVQSIIDLMMTGGCHSENIAIIQNAQLLPGVRDQHLKVDPNLRTIAAVPIQHFQERIGALVVFTFQKERSFDPDEITILHSLASLAAQALINTRMFDDIQKSNAELGHVYDTTFEGWARALDLRDKETEGHSQRVIEMTERLARAMGMQDAELENVRRGALLHDIGKMGIPDSILLKPGPLNDEEWEVMKKHPGYAYELLSPISYLKPALDIPYCHHEKWDGSGYPRGLRGEEIPFAARLFTVVDVWDALTSDRPYRPAWSKQQAREYILDQANQCFDPQVVAIFVSCMITINGGGSDS